MKRLFSLIFNSIAICSLFLFSVQALEQESFKSVSIDMAVEKPDIALVEEVSSKEMPVQIDSAEVKYNQQEADNIKKWEEKLKKSELKKQKYEEGIKKREVKIEKYQKRLAEKTGKDVIKEDESLIEQVKTEVGEEGIKEGGEKLAASLREFLKSEQRTSEDILNEIIVLPQTEEGLKKAKELAKEMEQALQREEQQEEIVPKVVEGLPTGEMQESIKKEGSMSFVEMLKSQKERLKKPEIKQEEELKEKPVEKKEAIEERPVFSLEEILAKKETLKKVSDVEKERKAPVRHLSPIKPDELIAKKKEIEEAAAKKQAKEVEPMMKKDDIEKVEVGKEEQAPTTVPVPIVRRFGR